MVNARPISLLPAIHELISGDLFYNIKLAISPCMFEHVFNQLHFCETRETCCDISPLIRKPEEIRFWLIETMESGPRHCLHNDLLNLLTSRLLSQLINRLVNRPITRSTKRSSVSSVQLASLSRIALTIVERSAFLIPWISWK